MDYLKEGVHRYTRFVSDGPSDTTLVFAYESRARAKRKWIACKSKYFEAHQIRYKSVNPRTYEPLLLSNNQNVGSNANSGSGALASCWQSWSWCPRLRWSSSSLGELFKHQWSLFSSKSRQQSLTGLPWERSGMAVNAESRRGEYYAALLLSAQRQNSARH